MDHDAGVIALAALSGPLPKAGVVVLAACVALALLRPSRAGQVAGMLGALILAPVLLLADIWHSPQLHVVHRHPLVAVVVGICALGVVVILALAFARWPSLFGLLVVVTLPFRIPIEAGGTTSNLLVPLYVVVGAGTLAFIVRPPRSGSRTELAGEAASVWARRLGGAAWVRWLAGLLALSVALYAIQSLYSPDFEKALQQMVFFYVPFALMFCILRRMDWTPELLRACLVAVVALALAFAAIGFAEYATKTLFLNPKLIAANDVHTYFTVNSVFFDPDIFGRFLALVMILVAAVLLYERTRRVQLTALGTLAVLWAGLVLTLSRSSLGALLLGLGILGALRWRAKPILIAAIAVVVVGIAAVAISPRTFGLNQGLNGASSGRAGLVSGGAQLFEHRPVWGNGSGSFQVRYHALNPKSTSTLSASHTIAITIAAEQGLIGLVPYVALVVVAAVVLLAGARASPTRAAVAAAFLALVFHTELYADFLEDPLTWTLLGVGVALAGTPRGADVRGESAPAVAV